MFVPLLRDTELLELLDDLFVPLPRDTELLDELLVLLLRLLDTELLPRLTDEEPLLLPLRLLDTAPLLLRELELDVPRLTLPELRDLLL